MTISKQVETSTGSHVGGHTCHNAVPTSPVSKSSRSYATKNQTPVRLASSKSANVNYEASLPLIQQLKVPVGDGPYVRAKQVQLVEKDPERAIALFWAAINVGDRVDSALKDMAVVMKQQNRGDEAIQAILSFRHLCSPLAQESLDNVLLDLYKKCGRLDDQIELLKHKLNLIHQGMVFNGKRTKTARSQGRKFQRSIREEATRLLGNLGWSYMQLCNYVAAEAIYRKALSIDADCSNKLCNLGLCLLKQHKYEEARVVLEGVTPMTSNGRLNSESHMKSFERSRALLRELRTAQNKSHIHKELASGDTANKNEQRLITPKEFDLWTHWKLWEPPAPNFAPDTGQISDTPAQISTNPALQHFKLSITNDPLTMQKSYKKSKETVGAAHITDDLHREMPNSICNYADDMLAAGTISQTTQRQAGSFKREIGPLSTVQPSKAKKNTHGNDKINGGICNFTVENYINIEIDACGLSNGWVSPAMSCQNPVARRLLLGYKGVQSDKESIKCVRAIANVTDELMNSSSCSREGSNVIDEDFQLHSCTMDTKFNDKARDDAIDAAILNFTCVDRVIESIVPDTSSAAQDIFNTNGMGNSNAHALKNARYHQDQIFAPASEGAHAQHVESLDSLNGVHQYRLRIFQEMTHEAPCCALNI